MKKIRITAGSFIFLILVFMTAALFLSREEETAYPLLNQLQYYYNEGWKMAVLDDTEVPEVQPDSRERMQELIERTLEAGKYEEITLPYMGRSTEGDTIVFINSLSESYAGLTMSFSCQGAGVSVVLDGEILCQQGAEDGDRHENNEIFVDLPNEFEQGTLWIGLTPRGPDAMVSLDNVRVEARDVVVIGLVEGSICEIGCCLLIMLMSIIMFVLALIRQYTRQPARGELFLGLAGLASGIYYFIATDTLSIFYDVAGAYAVQEYLMLMVPLFLALYFDWNLHAAYPRRFSALMLAVIINVALQILWQMLGVRNLAEMTSLSAAAEAAVCVTAIVSLIQLDERNRHCQILLAVLSMCVLLAGGIFDRICSRFMEYSGGNIAGQYSMALFNVLMVAIHILQLSKEYRTAAEENAHLLAEKIRAAEQQNIQLAKAKKEAEDARREALAANEAKGKFLARMSHEIRTPINAVLGMDEMILRESREESIKEYAMDIYTAGRTLLSLINDILDFSKIDSGKMEIVPVEYDICSMIHDLANMASQRAGDKNIRLEAEIDSEIPSRLYGDDVRIRQVLTNILTNAVKYTPEGTVWLRVRRRPASDRSGSSGSVSGVCISDAENGALCASDADTVVLAFEVEDTGIGIKEEDLPRLSAEFERIEEDRNRHIEGTGLGMNITIQLLSLMGSRLQVESIYGKGSKFYFDLEQKILDHTPIGDFEAEIHRMTQQYHYSTKLCAPDAEILVVDDNAVNRKVFRNLLKETRIQTAEAGGGAECLELVRKNHYDLIFLDHMMPGMDGVETLHRIRELPGCPCRDTPIVALTANAVSGAKERYLSEGFDAFLSKPIVPEKLENMIRKMLPERLMREAAEDGFQTDPLPRARTALPQDGRPEDSTQKSGAPGDFPEELPSVDGLDWQYAWIHLPDRELLEYTVKEFYAQIDSAADKLECFFEQIGEAGQKLHGPPQPRQQGQTGWPGEQKIHGPLEQYRIQVHAMKSLAATVGIMPLSGIARVLEDAAGDGKIDVVLSVTRPFLEEWRSYRRKLQGIFGIEDTAGKKVTDYAVMQALVEMLRLSMRELDIDQADRLMGQLREYEYPEEIDQNVRKLAEAVTDLDSEETDRLAELLIGQMGRQDGI